MNVVVCVKGGMVQGAYTNANGVYVDLDVIDLDVSSYRKADALRMLTSYAFGIEDLDAVSDEDRAEYEKEFEADYGITFKEAKERIPVIVSYFFQKADCNVGENTTWYEAIEAVFGGN